MKVLLISARNFGDAVISSLFIEILAQQNSAIEISVLSREQFRGIFYNNPHVANFFPSSFPMGTMKSFNAKAAMHLMKTAIKLRSYNFDYVVNLCGDLREIVLGSAISFRANTSPIFEKGHPYAKLIRAGLSFLVSKKILIPLSEANIYGIIDLIANSVVRHTASQPRLYDAERLPYRNKGEMTAIGLHLLASQECRIWPASRWRLLIARLRKVGMDVVLFGTPNDRPYLESCLDSPADDRCQIITGSLDQFFRGLERVRVLVAHDSFAIHAAYAIGTPSIMINGGNLGTMWIPPGAALVEADPAPPCYPCFNRPSCTALAEPYHCIRGIDVERVVDALRSFGVSPL